MALSDYPRVILAHAPTPLEFMPNFTEWLGGPDVYVKRDDCTGLAMGGNKARQLEYYLGEARARNADTVIITGAVQSNFVRQAAAAARKLGMDIHIQLEDRVAGKDDAYRNSGNVLLDRLLGATIHHFPAGGDEAAADAALEEIADAVRARGGRPYVVPLGVGHPPLGALGFFDCAAETVDQAARRNLAFDAVVLASGSGATHSGYLVGLRHAGAAVPVHGVCVRRAADRQAPRVRRRVGEVADMVGAAGKIGADDVIVRDDWLGPGYGRITPQVTEALEMTARTEGVLLDPVYTAKAMAGLIGLARQGAFAAGQKVLFVHTGGAPALFGYAQALTRGLRFPAIEDGEPEPSGQDVAGNPARTA